MENQWSLLEGTLKYYLNERERLFYEEFSDWKLESKVARYKGVKRDFKKG